MEVNHFPVFQCAPARNATPSRSLLACLPYQLHAADRCSNNLRHIPSVRNPPPPVIRAYQYLCAAIVLSHTDFAQSSSATFFVHQVGPLDSFTVSVSHKREDVDRSSGRPS